MVKQPLLGGNPFLDEVFTSPPVHSKPAILKTDFKPWHKPRKQWVRKFQWIHEVRKLAQQLCFENGRPLRYLSLPGKDLLDVRCFHGWCQENKVTLRFLGYNDPNDTADPSDSDLNLSVAELTQREFIDSESQVVPDKFERVGDPKSIAYTRMVEAGPFDIINLDLCNSIAGHVPLKKQDDYYRAMYEMVSFQKAKRHDPWLLFITTRANKRSVNPDAGQKLLKCIEKNAKAYNSFQHQLKTGLGIVYLAETDKLMTDGVSYRNLFGLGFGKWLLELLISGQPKWCIKMLESTEYRVRGSSMNPDMLSLAFECSLVVQQPNDSAGLARHPNAPIPETINEEKLALGLIKSINDVIDLDKIMTENAQLRQTMIEEAMILMTDARYDSEKFREWAMTW